MKDYITIPYKKLVRYCLLQERCFLELKNKMNLMQINNKDQEKMLKNLITNDYINEERFSRSLARGKFKKNNWGKIKITYQLKKKNISNENINKGLKEIDEKEYNKTIDKLIEKKKKEIKSKTIFEKKGKISTFLIQKGFEREIVWEKINKSYK